MITRSLRSSLKKGEWKHGDVFPSQRQLAERYAVGEKVIRCAIEILKGEGRLTVNAKRRLIVRQARQPGLVFDNLIVVTFSEFLHKILRSADIQAIRTGLENEAGKRHLPVLYAHSSLHRKHCPSDLSAMPLKGVALVGRFTNDVLKQYAKISTPVVLIDQPSDNWKGHAVLADNEFAGYDAINRLISRGHTRIAFLRRINTTLRSIDPDSKERQKGYEAAFEKNGLPVDRKLVYNQLSYNDTRDPAFHSIFDQKPPITAVLAADGGLAKLTADAAQRYGLSVPNDISLVSFEGMDAAYPECAGPRFDFKSFGCKAIEFLDAQKAAAQVIRMTSIWYEGRTVLPTR